MKTLALPIRWKVPLAVIGLSLLVGLVTLTASYIAVRDLTLTSALSEFRATGEQRRAQILDWVAMVRSNTNTLASNPTLPKALRELAEALPELGSSPYAELRKLYIQENPFPEDARRKLVKPEVRGIYHFRHSALHPYLDGFATENGYSDIYLITLGGDIIYSLAKTEAFATNLRDGDFAVPELALVFDRARSLKPGATAISRVTRAESAGEPNSLLISAPLHDSMGNMLGVVALRISLDALQPILNNRKGIGEAGSTYLTDDRQTVLITSDTSKIALGKHQGVTAPAQTSPDPFDSPLSNAETGLHAAVSIPIDDENWNLILERPRSDVLQEMLGFREATLLAALVLVTLVTSVGFLLTASILRPIARLSAAISRVAEGELEGDIPGRHRADEVGVMASALEDLRQKLLVAKEDRDDRERMHIAQQHVVNRLRGALSELAKGDLAHVIPEPFPLNQDALRQDYNAALAQMHSSVISVIATAEAVRQGLADLRHASGALSERTGSQAAAIEQAAAALDEMTASIRATADASRNVEALVLTTRGEAEEGGKVMRGAIAAMAGIEKSSAQISQIIGVIDDIAFQTNLLALNAGVEAARAGEAGKGFAVVASEVRALAQRSSHAAKEIKTLIATSSQEVEVGAAEVERSGESLARIVTRVQDVARLVSEIAQAAGQQSAGLADINAGISQLEGVTQQNAAMVTQSETRCSEILDDVERLRSLISHFRTDRMDIAEGPSCETNMPLRPAPRTAQRISVESPSPNMKVYPDWAGTLGQLGVA